MRLYFPLIQTIAILSLLCITGGCKKEDPKPLENITNGKSTALLNPNVSYGELTDADGNTYKTIKIGSQIWMAENLRTTKYNDGSVITNITDEDGWKSIEMGAYCNYNNTDDLDTIATFGRLYNWFAINTGKLAPKGWHIPTEAEWIQLKETAVYQARLMETGNIHWRTSWVCEMKPTNETGFTALPGGNRSYAFTGIGNEDYCWTSSPSPDNLAGKVIYITPEYFRTNFIYASKFTGCSVRCVKD